MSGPTTTSRRRPTASCRRSAPASRVPVRSIRNVPRRVTSGGGATPRHRCSAPAQDASRSIVTVAVVGAGSWGTTVAALVASHAPTVLWARGSRARGLDQLDTRERALPRGCRTAHGAAGHRLARRRMHRCRCRRHRGSFARLSGDPHRRRAVHRRRCGGDQPLQGRRAGNQPAHDRSRGRSARRSRAREHRCAQRPEPRARGRGRPTHRDRRRRARRGGRREVATALHVPDVSRLHESRCARLRDRGRAQERDRDRRRHGARSRLRRQHQGRPHHPRPRRAGETRRRARAENR